MTGFPGRLGDIGWHPLDDIGAEDIVERFEKLPVLVQRALVRLAYTVIDSSPQETRDADVMLEGIIKLEEPYGSRPSASCRPSSKFEDPSPRRSSSTRTRSRRRADKSTQGLAGDGLGLEHW